MLNNIKNKEKGFTIVELLIVIVIIAILAAITIVAYTGITNRGKASAAQAAASTLSKKLEAFNAENSGYPSVAGCITSAASCSSPSVTTTTTSSWYSAQGTAFTTTAGSLSTSTTAPSDPKTVYYVPNSTNGGCIFSYNYSSGAWATPVQVGTATCSAVSGTAQTGVAV